ncbi:MAG: hypothetical protein ABFS03_10635 [Chloroflexota bacterium]
MYLSFREAFDLPIGNIFPYFESPSTWAKLYGAMKPTKALKDGWYAVPLKKFPFPLVAKNVEYEHEKRVRWIFGGFWRGVGEVNFYTENNQTVVEGFEYITPHGLWFLASLFEKTIMEKEFKGIWDFGWRRIRKEGKLLKI